MRMPLPDAAQAYVPPEKLSGYLLSERHPRGREKARPLQAYGFSSAHVRELEMALLAIAMNGALVEEEITAHGMKYVVVGAAPAPTGRMIRLRTVWIVELPDHRPRFVTAYPAR
jgi:hypothetical protein